MDRPSITKSSTTSLRKATTTPTTTKTTPTITKTTTPTLRKATTTTPTTTAKNISTVTNKSNNIRNNITSSVTKSNWGGTTSTNATTPVKTSNTVLRKAVSWGSSSWGGSSSNSNWWSALSFALSKANGNSNASVSSDGSNTTIATKSDTNKLIPGTSIKTGGRTNYQTYDANGNLISDFDVEGSGYGTEKPSEWELYSWETTDDTENNINPYEDVMNWAWDEEEWNSGSVEEWVEGEETPKTYTQEEVDEMYNQWNRDYDDRINEAYEQINSLKWQQEETSPEKSEEEKRLETPAFNQFSWNSYVENRPAELSPVSVPNPNDPLTDPTSYDAPITEALNRLWADLNQPKAQQVEQEANVNAVTEADGMPQYTWDINSMMQWYNNVFNNIEWKWINANTAREFAQAYNQAKNNIQKYATEHNLTQEEYERLLAQLRWHPLIKNLSENQWQRRK